MKGRCTGSATSTFGGGGGTKVFCSQALNIAIAASAKAARQAAAPLCAAVRCDLKRAGEREAFILVPQSVLFRKRLIRKSAFRHPMKIATIRLRRNRKAKMMRPEFFSANAFKTSLRLKRRLPATTKDLFK
ncbi:hypothetical protein [Bradyrhizobium sp. sGM-13]|uniref:hypothetical protein n=1 Tax=Bradyrhizobium sp. sGM-13 TaxID=2831781 RepID=UPI0020BD8AA6|nr:hypothetical protein [Bradyrhizobium sp. sGM-13]